jgi:hypothetical protein
VRLVGSFPVHAVGFFNSKGKISVVHEGLQSSERYYIKGLNQFKIIVISPTFNSNKSLMKELDIKEEDIFTDPDDPSLPEKITRLVDAERDEFMRYQHLVKNFEKIMQQVKTGILRVEDGMMDDYLLSYYDIVNNKFSLPEPRYKRFKQGKPPILSLLVDDCLCTKLMSNRRWFNCVTRHRHLGQFPKGGAVGLSLFICVQNYKADAGRLNKCVRNNATSLILFVTKDKSELDQIAESYSGEVSVETFMKMYEEDGIKGEDFI